MDCAARWSSLRSAQPTQAPKTVAGYYVLAVCGTMPTAYKAGSFGAPTMDVNGQTCVNK